MLLVDDDPVILRLLEVNFRLEGFETMTASRGPEAIALAARQPDAIVLDLMLPEMDGHEVYRKLQDAGVYVTDTTTPGGWADVPSDLAPGTRVARGGFDVNSDIGTVVMMDPKDITLGNDGLWEDRKSVV